MTWTGIKPGDHIDVRDCEGDWYEALILSVAGHIAKCHFINYSSKWDCNIQLSNDNVAQRNTHSKPTGTRHTGYKALRDSINTEYTGKPDNHKYLLECVHELLFLRKEDDNYIRSAKEIGIAEDQLEQFIQRGEAADDPQKTKILNWVRTQSHVMAIDLQILETNEPDTAAVPLHNTLHQYAPVHGLNLMNLQVNPLNHAVHSVNHKTNAIPAPPADILASCIATLPKIMLSNTHTTIPIQPKTNNAASSNDSGSLMVNPLHMTYTDVSGSTISSLSSSASSTISSTSLATSLYSSPTNINIPERANYAGAKRMRTQHDDALPAAKKRKLIALDIDREIDGDDSEYSSSSFESDDLSDSVSISESEADRSGEESDSVMVPQTSGTKITFIKMSHKQFEREQKEFEKQAQIAKQEILQKERKEAIEQERIRIKQQQKQKELKALRRSKKGRIDTVVSPKPRRKYKTRTKMDINVDELDDFSEFKVVLSDANLNLNHSIYPNRKFRGIAKSGRRWRARTCISGKTQYGEKSFYNPFLAAMEYDRLIRANRQQELSGAVKTKTQIILNFPYGLPQEQIRIHKVFERELQQMDSETIKKTFGVRYRDDSHLFGESEDEDDEYMGKGRKRRKKHKRKKRKKKKGKYDKRKEEPIIDNKGLATKIPMEFLKKMNSSLYGQSDRLKPFGPCCVVDDTVPVITHFKPKQQEQEETNDNCEKEMADEREDVPKNTDDWVKDGCCATSLFFGYRTLHICSNE
eukprot:763989_1